MNSYVAGGWSATLVILGLYGWRIRRRGRRLAERLPGPERTWR